MFITLREDGTTVRRQDRIKGIPTYSDWLKLLLDRGCAHTVRERETRSDSPNYGQIVAKIIPFDRHMEQAHTLHPNDTITTTCLGCGKDVSLGRHRFDKLEMDRIRIGSLVQFPVETETGKDELTISYRVQPVTRMGLGCKECQVKMMHLESAAMAVNEARAQHFANLASIADIRAQLAQRRGAAKGEVKSLGSVAGPSIQTAFIELLKVEG